MGGPVNLANRSDHMRCESHHSPQVDAEVVCSVLKLDSRTTCMPQAIGWVYTLVRKQCKYFTSIINYDL